jgi:surfeit locus 1 family protein
MIEAPSHFRFGVMSLAALAMFAALLALGTWQVRRLAWKENLIQTIESRIHQPPRPLEAWFKTEPGTDYWPVQVEGTFLHSGERHFFSTYDGQSGYDVITPMEVFPGSFVFVNRGFVPFDRKDAATRAEGQIAGKVKVIGLARSILTKKPSWLVPDNEPDKNIFYWKDFAKMRDTAALPVGSKALELFIDAGKAGNPGGLPIGGVTIVDLPNSHLSYAVTWYGLAATLAAIWSVLAFRHFRPRRLT